MLSVVVFYMNIDISQRYLWRKKSVSYLRTCDMAPLMGQPICLSLIMQLIWEMISAAKNDFKA